MCSSWPFAIRPKKIATTPASPCGSCLGPYVCIAKRDMAGAVQAAPRPQILLAGELRRPVGCKGKQGRVLVCRPVALAVDGAAGGGEDHLRLVRPRRLEDVDRADDVHLGVERGLGDGDANVGLGGEVEARLRLRLRERAG